MNISRQEKVLPMLKAVDDCEEFLVVGGFGEFVLSKSTRIKTERFQDAFLFLFKTSPNAIITSICLKVEG